MFRLCCVFLALCSPVLAGGPCNSVLLQSPTFVQSTNLGYVLYSAPQIQAVSGATSTGSSYSQKDKAELLAEIEQLKAMVRAVAEDRLASGEMSHAAFATAAQPTINAYCVGCHRGADAAAGKGFALDRISTLTDAQRQKIFRRIMAKDEAKQMPPVGSAQRSKWNSDAASKVLDELANTPELPTGASQNPPRSP